MSDMFMGFNCFFLIDFLCIYLFIFKRVSIIQWGQKLSDPRLNGKSKRGTSIPEPLR
jgi:hypothetical protein